MASMRMRRKRSDVRYPGTMWGGWLGSQRLYEFSVPRPSLRVHVPHGPRTGPHRDHGSAVHLTWGGPGTALLRSHSLVEPAAEGRYHPARPARTVLGGREGLTRRGSCQGTRPRRGRRSRGPLTRRGLQGVYRFRNGCLPYSWASRRRRCSPGSARSCAPTEWHDPGHAGAAGDAGVEVTPHRGQVRDGGVDEAGTAGEQGHRHRGGVGWGVRRCSSGCATRRDEAHGGHGQPGPAAQRVHHAQGDKPVCLCFRSGSLSTTARRARLMCHGGPLAIPVLPRPSCRLRPPRAIG